MLCCDCQYLGDKYSFFQPNDMVDVDENNEFIKHFYCCCGDCDMYEKDITSLEIKICECFEEN